MCLLLLINKLIASPTEVELRHEFRHHDCESHCFYEYEIYLENHFCHFNRDKSRNRNFERQRDSSRKYKIFSCRDTGVLKDLDMVIPLSVLVYVCITVADPGGRGQGGHTSPVPVKIGKEKDCSQGNHINFLFVGQFSSTCSLNLFGTATARLSII